MNYRRSGHCKNNTTHDTRTIRRPMYSQAKRTLQATADKTTAYKTSSSAVAKRPRDASCLSVVSFNSTKRRAESFIVSYISYRFVTASMRCSVVFGFTLRLFVINIRRLLPQSTPLLTTSNVS